MRVLYDFVYPDAKKYKGKAKHLVFKVVAKAPVVPVAYLKKHITNAVEGLRDKGYEPLRLIVFENKPKNEYIYHVWYYRRYGSFQLIPIALALSFVGGAVATYLLTQSMQPREEDWNWDPSQATVNPNVLAVSPWMLFGIAGVLIGGAFLLKQLK